MKELMRKLLPKAVRPHRILGGPLRGRWIVASWHDYPAGILGRTELPLLNWLQSNVQAGETWLDIGAHYGYTAIALSNLVGSRGRVFALEPIARTAGYLSWTGDLNGLRQLTIIPMGAGQPESVELVRVPTMRGMADMTQRGGMESETIVISRLEWLWPRICGTLEQLDGVKIDVQGMEIEVLRGMRNTLRRFKPKLVIEIHRNVDREAFLAELEQAGYSRTGVPIDAATSQNGLGFQDDHSYAFPRVEG